METDIIYSIALSVCSSPALNKIWDSIQIYKPEEIYSELSKAGEPSTQGYITKKYPENPLSAAHEIFSECMSKKIKILTYWDEEYPLLLREISRPPVVLYYRGAVKPDDGKSVAIVGTRKAGKKSAEIARRLSGELSSAGYTIVSGMAIGIDREAHLGALKNDGPTIGVLANGIDIVYPAYNRDIYSAINSSDNSALVSEYPPGIYAGTWTFVRRNRIISGLSLGTVIVKAAKKSGALITAHHALEQNREVFACPGPTFDLSYTGCNDLIRSGAILVSGTDDIINELSDYEKRISMIREKPVSGKKKNIIQVMEKSRNELPFPPAEDNYPSDSVEHKILKLLSGGESDIDNLVRMLEYTANEINEAVVMLELSNDIKRDGNLVSRF